MTTSMEIIRPKRRRLRGARGPEVALGSSSVGCSSVSLDFIDVTLSALSATGLYLLLLQATLHPSAETIQECRALLNHGLFRFVEQLASNTNDDIFDAVNERCRILG